MVASWAPMRRRTPRSWPSAARSSEPPGAFRTSAESGRAGQFIVARIVYLRLPARVDDDGRERLLDDRRSDDLVSRHQVGADENVGLRKAVAEVGAPALACLG